MKHLKKYVLLGMCFIGIVSAQAQLSGGGEANQELKTNEESLEKFMDMRFGMFIHFGPATLRAVNIGWSRGKEVTEEDYDSLYKEFNPVLFNAEAWVKAAKDAGVKYLILLVKHHDGFCMWDSAYTDYDMGSTPYGKGIVKELAAACKNQGIAFGPYYSISDWHHKGYPVVYPSNGYSTSVEEKEITNPEIKKGMDKYIIYMKNHLKEIIDDCDPDFMWFNGEYEWPWTHKMGMELYKYVRSLKDGILINDKLDKGREIAQSAAKNFKFAGDYRAYGLTKGKFDNINAWEDHTSISDQWSWKPNDNIKSTKECIQTLLQTVGGGGNLLFNIGPMPDGRIEQRQINRLKEIGDWLKVNGETVYGTRGGPYMPTEKMVSTHKDNKIYLHLLKKEDQTLRLPFVKGIKVKKAYFLEGNTPVSILQGKTSINIRLPKVLPDEIASVIVLEINRPASDIKLIKRVNY